MIPLRDDIPSQRYPVLTVGLIAANIIVFFHELSLGPKLSDFILDWSIVPARYTSLEVASLFGPIEQAVPFITSTFLHGGWMHLIGNMWTLWIFGDNVEDSLGRVRFLLLYFIGGAAAGLVHVFTNLHSAIPTIGASGAVAVVMGAYFLLYPHARVTMVIPPFIFGPFFVVPAVLFLGWWFILQFFSGTLSLATSGRLDGIAWWAHVGGFIFGAFLCAAINASKRKRDRSRNADL